MSRARVALLAVALALAGVLSMRPAAPGASARPAEVVESPAARVPEPRHTPPVPAPARDIFVYTREPDAEPPPRVVAPAVVLPAPPSLAAPAPLVPEGPRLVGILRQGGALKAAISVDGEVVVVRAGERAGAYTVLAIDEDDGVRLSDPSGAALTLAPPQE